ncbi:adenine phosphoribosyltransferase [Arthrobacter sp. TMN-37]
MKISPAGPPEPGSARDLVEKLCAPVPDFPLPGIVFRDLTPVFADASAFRTVIDALIEPFRGAFDVVAGIEARGFLLAAAVGYAAGTGVVTVRKAGKLPRSVYSEQYDLEYGQATLEIHRDDIAPGARVLVLDDVLATGGTLAAAARLFERGGAQVIGCGVVLELAALAGRDLLPGHRVHALSTM